MCRKYLICICLLFLLAFSFPAAHAITYNESDVIARDGDTVVIAAHDTVVFGPDDVVDRSGADGQVTFWQLPLLFQIMWVTGYVLAFFAALAGALAVLPFVQGKLKRAGENETRNLIYEFVKKNPGTTAADISRQEGINLGTVRYHLNQLQASHKIVLSRSDKFVRIFQNSHTYDEREKIVISALNRRAGNSILSYLLNNPGATNSQIADHLRISESGTHVQLKKLLRDEILRANPEGRSLKYFLRDDVKAIIDKQVSI